LPSIFYSVQIGALDFLLAGFGLYNKLVFGIVFRILMLDDG